MKGCGDAMCLTENPQPCGLGWYLVGFVDLWGRFVGRADMYMRNGLHLSGKGAAVFDELSATVDACSMGNIKHIFGSKHCLN